jgi:rubredoxin
MDEFGDRTSQRYSEEIKDVGCPICKKAKIRVAFVSGWMEWKVSRIAAGAKRTPFFHDPKIKVHSKCPECKASREEIKEALERGGKKMSHEERLKRIKEAGLPTVIES